MSVPVMDKDVYKGQDKDYGIRVAKSDGMYDLTSCQLMFYMRTIVGGTPVITKDSGEVGEITIAANQVTNKGEATLTLEDTDTTLLDSGRYYYDLWLIDPASKKDPILTGYFWVLDVAPSILGTIRELLDDGGELRVQAIPDELIIPSSLAVLYVTRRRIQSVLGVWAFTDDDHTGTNYYTGGGFDVSKGKIWLGTALATANTYVRVTYSWESGISDNAVYQHLHNSRAFVVNYTGISFRYGECTTDLQIGAEAMAIAGAVIASILTINGANVAQMGYNFRLDEFEIQTKLWGEGMIAEALFNMYLAEYNKWRLALGKTGTIVIATPATEKYNLTTLIDASETASQSYDEGSE